MSQRSLVAPGTLLLSVPQMLDPNFMHTVVLMVEHNEDGAYGLVVNRPSPLDLALVMARHEHLGGIHFPVHLGGPVARENTLHVLHRCPDELPGGMEIVDGLCLGADLETLGALLSDGADHTGEVRLFLGYSGWGGGQLDLELASGSWLPAPPDADLVFSDLSAESLWRRAVRSLGDLGEGLSRLPPDVSWN